MADSDEQYEARLSTTFETPEVGISAVKERIKKAKRIRINSIPMSLLEDLLPLVRGKDVMIILPNGVKPRKVHKDAGKVGVTRSRIYRDYKGVEALVGSVGFSDIIFTILWTEEQIIEVETMEYPKCVKCMGQTYDVAWRYAKT
jgi:hypothetical protein